ncbi:MAG: hypothetical protein Q7S59_07805 [Sulfurimonas sp.]|nr:hypothetical protein [Sulfurimonas sp.]
MLKWLLLIFIIPSLLFGKFYSVENKNNSSQEYVQTYHHTHHHDHENDTSSHVHSHMHFIKTSNILVDSLLFLLQDEIFIATLENDSISNITLFIQNDITQDLFRPPII